MSTLIVLVTDRDNWTFPPTQIAAMYEPKARALGHDRIRVEQGARVSEYPVRTIRQFTAAHGLHPTANRVLRKSRGDYEDRRLVYPGWRKETT